MPRFKFARKTKRDKQIELEVRDLQESEAQKRANAISHHRNKLMKIEDLKFSEQELYQILDQLRDNYVLQKKDKVVLFRNVALEKLIVYALAQYGWDMTDRLPVDQVPLLHRLTDRDSLGLEYNFPNYERMDVKDIIGQLSQLENEVAKKERKVEIYQSKLDKLGRMYKSYRTKSCRCFLQTSMHGMIEQAIMDLE